MKGMAYNSEGKWWVKYLVTDDVSSIPSTPMIASFWCKVEVHPDSIVDIPTSTLLANPIDVEFTLHHVKPKYKYMNQPTEFFAVINKGMKETIQNPFKWEYRVIEPDGRIISVDEYMRSEDYNNRLSQKINDFLTDEKEKELISLFSNKNKEEEDPQPVYVGTLTKPFGIKDHSTAEIGHPVFELKDKYLITILNPKNEPHVVSFYKETLEQYIKRPC